MASLSGLQCTQDDFALFFDWETVQLGDGGGAMLVRQAFFEKVKDNPELLRITS